jgi:hypothetical protein
MTLVIQDQLPIGILVQEKLIKMDDEKYQLTFDIQRSIRYHDRRMAHFERLHQLSSVLTILLAGSILMQIAGAKYDPPWWLIFLSFVAAIMSAIDIVIGYSKCAGLHSKLKRDFCELQSCIEEADSDAKLAKCRKRRLLIEQNEPPIYRALDLLCHNEMMVAYGLDPENPNFASISRLQRITADFLRWSNISICKGKNNSI